MARDILRAQSNERVDLGDFTHLSDTGLQSNIRHYGEQFLTDPAESNVAFIVDGFQVTNPVAEQVTVTLGRAILGQREGGQIFQGVLTSEGEATRTIDASTYTDGSYGVYVRFEYVAGDSSSRAFWNPQGNGSEFAQTISTRRLANWSMRMELASPGAEWLLIGSLVVVSNAIFSGPIDVRNFYFEGKVDDSFESHWSTEGGGVANDRHADREDYGVKDLQTFTAAMRQCIEDIRGRGLRRWYEKGIGGLNVGFDTDPLEAILAVGDANFALDGTVSSSPKLHFDKADGDYLAYSLDEYQFKIGSNTKLQLNADFTRFWNDVNILTGGLAVGYTADHSVILNDEITVGDANFGLFGSTTAPAVIFSTADLITFVRADSEFLFRIGGSPEMTLKTTGLEVLNGLVVGHTTDPVNDVLSIGNPDFAFKYNAGAPILQFETDNEINYNTDEIFFKAGGVEGYSLTSARLTMMNAVRLRLEGVTSDPSSGLLDGDMVYRTQTALPMVYDGGRWQNLISEATYLSGSQTLNTGDTTERAHPRIHTFPAATLRIGTVVKIRAVYRINGDQANDPITVMAYIGTRTSETVFSGVIGGGAVFSVTYSDWSYVYVDLTITCGDTAANSMGLISTADWTGPQDASTANAVPTYATGGSYNRANELVFFLTWKFSAGSGLSVIEETTVVDIQ